MDTDFRAGEYAGPNGEVVRVERASDGTWGYILIRAREHQVIAGRLTPALWRQLKAARADTG